MLRPGKVSALVPLPFGRISQFCAELAFAVRLGTATDAQTITDGAFLPPAASPEMGGAMAGFWRIVWGRCPLGARPADAQAGRWGPPLRASLHARVSLFRFGVLLLTVPRLRRPQ